MCAICGIYNLDGKPINYKDIEAMCKIMNHRGPDDSGVYINKNIGFGHNRLSIIDLSDAAHQPMTNENKHIILIFDGMIYNYLGLRESLKAKGHIFRSYSGAEVIIHSYEEWGKECVNKFNGMFAFAIWDNIKGELFIARDRFGIKPLYYFFDGKRFIFASEIKAIIKTNLVTPQPNYNIIYHYLVNKLIDFGEDTSFKGIKRLLPGHFAILKENILSIKKYWNFSPNEYKQSFSNDYYVEKFYELLEDSVRLCLRSDVPIGVGLSGGLDSSSITALASQLLNQQLMTFSVFYTESDEYDEREYINLMIDKFKLKSYFILPEVERFMELLPKIIWYLDEPIPFPGVFSEYYVLKLASEKVKVILNGQGGDELLAGYQSYFYYYLRDLLNRYKNNPLKYIYFLSYIFKLVELLGISFTGNILRKLISPFLPQQVKNIKKVITQSPIISEPPEIYVLNNELKNKFEEVSFDIPIKYNGTLNDVLYHDLTIRSLPPILRYEDRVSMAFSLELRLPFLDYRLVEFILSLPIEQKINNFVTKYILRQAMKRILPEKITFRKDKKGFPTPVGIWIMGSEKEKIKDILFSRECSQRGVFNINNLKECFKLHIHKKMNLGSLIWRWINTEIWFQQFID